MTEKITVNLLDNNFSHQPSSCSGKIYEKIIFLRDNFLPNKDFIFTDNFINATGHLPAEKCFGWILEPYAFIPHVYDYAKINHKKFNKIFSSNIEFINSIPNGIYIPFGTCWIKEPKLYKKTKKVSMIFSNKNFLPGHKLRHEIFHRVRDKNIDFFGSGVKEISDKEQALCEYMYSIVIENSCADGYFTEKIIDSFAVGTIPIYYGCSNIGDYFNKKGILQFSSIEELSNILDNISEITYKQNTLEIEENFNKCKTYEIPEESIYKYFINRRTK